MTFLLHLPPLSAASGITDIHQPVSMTRTLLETLSVHFNLEPSSGSIQKPNGRVLGGGRVPYRVCSKQDPILILISLYYKTGQCAYFGVKKLFVILSKHSEVPNGSPVA